jgi:hypothetical protein
MDEYGTVLCCVLRVYSINNKSSTVHTVGWPSNQIAHGTRRLGQCRMYVHISKLSFIIWYVPQNIMISLSMSGSSVLARHVCALLIL